MTKLTYILIGLIIGMPIGAIAIMLGYLSGKK
jgi:uncharacterized membrane-anchored protein YhcB (DUF1043 family)